MVIGTPSSRASAVAVPNLPMMSEAFMPLPYDNCRVAVNSATNCVVARFYETVQFMRVIDTDELLTRLKARDIRNADIARALNLPDSRIPEIRTKRRALKLDEAATLVRVFQLEEAREVAPIPLPAMRLVVRWVASRLRVHPTEAQVEELAIALRAFSAFVSDRKIRTSIDAAEGFFRALDIQRPKPEEEAPPGTDPHHAH